MNRYVLIICLGLLFLSIADAKQSSYVGQEGREIKALSAEKLAGYLSGKGMRFAKAAELNHYPGPKHVLEIADKLRLTETQKNETKALFERMRTNAVLFGRQLVEKEKELDHLFAQNQADAENVHRVVMEAGKLQAELRFVHLSAHLEQKSILTPHQTRIYDKARGYTAGGDHGAHHSKSMD